MIATPAHQHHQLEHKLEITKRLEDLAQEGMLRDPLKVVILNLPDANYCEKRAERVYSAQEDARIQSCRGCVHNGLKSPERMAPEEIDAVIDTFAHQYGTRFVTINGRGDPFHPSLREATLHKICYGAEHGMTAYIFTAGDHLDEETCQTLARHGANIMISLYGNRFLDAGFFEEKHYRTADEVKTALRVQGVLHGVSDTVLAKVKIQDEQGIAENLRRLISTYQQSEHQPEPGTTRIGMNYVVTESDLGDQGAKVRALKHSANEHGIYFVCNVPFERERYDPVTWMRLKTMAEQYSDFGKSHSTTVDGQCQMGAGSGVTVDFNGAMLRCPYMPTSEGKGKFLDLTPAERDICIAKFREETRACVMRD
ncbi:TPA: hypothetical protein HA253_02895 [Candidatus Woesearchaeota archaeon]|nr:hypothetical protein [Candidatus Woesearchaeota archaeon]